MTSKYISILLLLFAALSSGFFFYSKKSTQATNTPDTAPVVENTIPKKEPESVDSHIVSEGETFTVVAESLGFRYSDALEIVSSSEGLYDLTRVVLGKEFRKYSTLSGDFLRLEYDINSDERLTIEKIDNSYIAKRAPIPYEIQTATDFGTIENSFYVSGLDAGLSEELIIEAAETFGWTIDFATQIQQGDTFRLFYEKRYLDGELKGTGRILAAQFVNSGKEYTGYLFENEDGKDAYYNKEGESLVKQFLKAPLQYNRITSGFTYARFHPTLQRTTPHRAIDYAAPIGTPIHAVGDGSVTYAGWNGGYGIYVDIHHNDTYETQYAHLSKIAPGIRPGTRVSQGDIIGYVGSTGFSTGPHLHYQIKKNGTLVNPLEVDLPAGEPVPEEKKEEFLKEVERLNAFLY